MRRIICDQFEFDPPDSEELLELAIAAPSHSCPDLAALLVACGASAIAGATPSMDWKNWHMVECNLERFAGISLPHPSQMRKAVLIRDDWDDIELGIDLESVLVWYHWTTSA